jgi:hypothetical protein
VALSERGTVGRSLHPQLTDVMLVCGNNPSVILNEVKNLGGDNQAFNVSLSNSLCGWLFAYTLGISPKGSLSNNPSLPNCLIGALFRYPHTLR